MGQKLVVTRCRFALPQQEEDQVLEEVVGVSVTDLMHVLAQQVGRVMTDTDQYVMVQKERNDGEPKEAA